MGTGAKHIDYVAVTALSSRILNNISAGRSQRHFCHVILLAFTAAVHTQLGPKVPGCWTGRGVCPFVVGDAPINPQPIRDLVRVYNKLA